MKGLQERLETVAMSFAEQKAPGTGKLLRRAMHVVITSQISRMAAALSYRTVFGLIPVLAIGVAFLGGFATDTQVEKVVLDVLDFTGLADIVVEPEAIDPQPSGAGVVGPASPEELAQTAKLDEWLQLLVAKVRQVSFVAIGLTGLLMLIYAALSFMVEIERAANTIYHAPTGRSWVRRITQYWTTLTLGSIFLVGTFYIGGRVTDTVKSLTGSSEQQQHAIDTPGRDDPGVLDSEVPELLTGAEPESEAADAAQAGAPGSLESQAEGSDVAPGGDDQSTDIASSPEPDVPQQPKAQSQQNGADSAAFLVAAAGVAVSLVIAFLLLLFLYMTIPNARVSVQCAAIGAGFAAIMWEAGKQGFTLFVVHSAAQRLYGAIALIPLFLLWVYITWIIVLFGLQISYVLQNFRTFAIPEDERDGPVVVDPLTLLRVAAVVARRFAAGKTASVGEVAEAVGADEKTSLLMLDKLSETGLVHRVPLGQDCEEFALARPANEIAATELLELAGRMAGGTGPQEDSDRLTALRRAQLDAAAGVTLADLVSRREAVQTGDASTPRTSAEPSPAL